MKILWVSEVRPDPNSGAGGTELLMVQGLRQRGHAIDTVWEDDLPRRIRHGNLHYAFELPHRYAQAIERQLNRCSYEVISINLGQSYLAAQRLRRRDWRGAFIVRSHGLDDHLDQVMRGWRKRLGIAEPRFLKRWLGRGLERMLHRQMKLAARACDGYVVSNSLDGRWLTAQHGLAPERIAVIPQAPAAAFGAPTPATSDPERFRRVLYVANYHFGKSPATVAQAFDQLAANPLCAQLTWICHPQDHQRVRDLLDAQTLPRVRLLGWMTQSELVQEFDQHGIFLYPTFFDGFGKVFLEAMARGLVVIGTPAGGMVDVIRDEENGYTVDFGDSVAIVRRACVLMQSPDVAQRISARALASSREYTWPRVAEDLEAFFQRCWSAKNRGQA